MRSRPESKKRSPIRVGIVAPSAKISPIELSLGLEKLRASGFFPVVHPQCKKAFQFFAGHDEDRAKAFVQMALDPSLSVIWIARGGYGMIRTLPRIAELIGKRNVPMKLLVGYSDATALQNYAVERWGWSSLYAPMPGVREFLSIASKDWKALTSWIRKNPSAEPWGRLRFAHKTKRVIEAPLVGGNLTCFTSLIGTPQQIDTRGKIIFFEEVDEALYRIDRMVQQIEQSGSLRGARGIVLGNFLDCTDRVGQVLIKMPTNLARVKAPHPRDLVALRPSLPASATIHEIFGELGKKYGIPVAYGLPVGHGPGHAPLPIGARYRLTPQGEFKCVHWKWLDAL